MMLSILGCGWLGLPLAQSLRAQGHEVKGSTTTPEKLPKLEMAGLQAFLVDLNQSVPISPAFLDAEALLISIPFKNPARFEWLLTQIQGSPIDKLLFISSTSVYLPAEQPLTELAPVDPEHPLVKIEILLRQGFAGQMTLLRLAGLIGPGRHPGRFFARGNPLENPEAPVNLIHRDDCIHAILAIIAQGVWGETFHFCADQHPTRRNFYTRAAQAYGASPPQILGAGQQGKCLDNTYSKARLGLSYEHSNLDDPAIFSSCLSEFN